MKSLILGLVTVATLAGAVPVAAQGVDQREARQAQRIHQGVASGALTRGEAGRLEHREMRLHRTEARMRWRSGGYLNHYQKRRLARMENHDSRAIYRLKHNGNRI